MTMIDLDELGQRLRELPLEKPDPRGVAARVLAKPSAAAPRRVWSVPPVLRPIAAVAAVLLAGWSVFYFSPATGAALADVPGVGSFSTFVLEASGLGNGSSITAEDASASQSGVTIRLLGVSANPLRTVLLLNISPANALMVTSSLTDQFGTSYENRGGYGDLRTGDWAAIFAPPSPVAATLGMRFTLTLSGVNSGQSVIPGTWTMHGIALSHLGRTFTAPGSASMGQVTITFSSGREADSVFELTAHVHGVTSQQLGPNKKQSPGAVPQLTVEVIDSAGKQLAVPFTVTDEPGGLGIDILAYGASNHGTYTVRISIQGFGSVERSISY